MKTLLSLVVFAASLATGYAKAETPAYGGDMIITYKDEVTTLDPAIGYDWQNWGLIKSVFDGLMDYEPGTTNLRPGLASDFEISEDSLTYRFTLREGVKFHNGRTLVAEDVVYSLKRAVNPQTRSPGQGFFNMIEGYEAAAAGKTPLSGVYAPDQQTVVIRLSRPDATFLHILAMNFAHVVPAEAVRIHGEDFGRHPVGTGAFQIAEWAPGRRLVLKRNPGYWREGLPYLDSIVLEFGQEPVAAFLRAQRDEIDIPGDGIPPSKFVEVVADPELNARLLEGSQLHTGYITINRNIAPFDRLGVRQALNMAIDKERIVALINGRALPASQPLPPSMPGYDPTYKGYPYDVEAAKALLAEAGFPAGFTTDLYVLNTDPNPRIARAIQEDLKKIGIELRLHSLNRPDVLAAGSAGEAPLLWSGGLGWIADFPDPSVFYAPILGCSGTVEGGWNWGKFCDPALDAKAAKADSLTGAHLAGERLSLWAEIYREVMDQAVWVPVFNEQRFTLRSERMAGADVLYSDPVTVPVNYDYIYMHP